MTDWSTLLADAFDTAVKVTGYSGNDGYDGASALTGNINLPDGSVTWTPQTIVTPVTNAVRRVDGVTAVTFRSPGGYSAASPNCSIKQEHSAAVTSVTAVTTSEDAPFALRRLRLMLLPDSFRAEFFRQLIIDSERFFDRWSGTINVGSWSDINLFGVHPRAPLARYDAMGLLLLVRGREVIELHADHARIGSAGRSTLTYQKKISAEAVPVWELV